MIGFIWAEDLDQNIGNKGDLPWHLPADLKRFKTLTSNHTIVMGRNTYESIGRPLPNRRSVVLSSSMPDQNGIELVRSTAELGKLLQSINDDVFIIGGSIVFSETLQFVDRLYRTVVQDHFEGDTRMVPIDYREWQLIDADEFQKDEKNSYDYVFETFKRKNS